MEIKKYENIILSELEKVIKFILKNNMELNILAKSRAGAEISSFLEDKFVIETKEHKYFKKSEASPYGATKNPWDAITYFCFNKHEEKIWIDFKAIKVSSADSNPDIGTPDKIIKFIEEGYFYLVYVFVYYEETKTGLKFVETSDNKLTKIYLLKDINSTFRRNPKNQLQVNISAKPEYRTRQEFINILIDKIKESHKRQLQISKQKLMELDKGEMKEKLIKINKISEEKIKNL